MKRKNIVILIITCILSLCVFCSLLVYAFDLQENREMQERKEATENSTGPSASVSPIPENTAAPSDSPAIIGSEASGSDSSDSEDLAGSSENSVTATPVPTEPADLSEGNTSAKEPIILGFAGDVNLDEVSYPSEKYDSEGQDITKCLSSDLLTEMNAADIMMLNNEFAYSTRGTQAPDKQYTFRADPKRADILKQMGVDIVSLANNHSLDFGPDALTDTFDTLDQAGIDYVGAGLNLARAMEPIYYTVGDKTIAYVAASRVIPVMSWYASESSMGVLGTYNSALTLESIKEAKETSDYVVVFVHWGVERTDFPQDYQRELAKKYIDAGADAVIGCHPHVMQGFEYYQGKPIAYSLGNFWFNNSDKKSGMVKLYLEPDQSVKVQLLPAMNKDTFTYLLTDKTDKEAYYQFIRGLSYDVTIDEDGFITEKKE